MALIQISFQMSYIVSALLFLFLAGLDIIHLILSFFRITSVGCAAQYCIIFLYL
jgi:hypothetical protein